jgi:hypothetical protein
VQCLIIGIVWSFSSSLSHRSIVIIALPHQIRVMAYFMFFFIVVVVVASLFLSLSSSLCWVGCLVAVVGQCAEVQNRRMHTAPSPPPEKDVNFSGPDSPNPPPTGRAQSALAMKALVENPTSSFAAHSGSSTNASSSKSTQTSVSIALAAARSCASASVTMAR